MVKITDEMVVEFASRRSRGDTWKSIGRHHGVDPRSVKSRVEKLYQGSGRDRAEAAALQLDSKYLEEHHRTLMVVASGLLKISQIDPAKALNDEDAQVLLQHGIASGLEKVAGLLERRGLDIRTPEVRFPGSTTQEGTLQRLAPKLYGYLKEHEPRIHDYVDGTSGWKRCWSEFHKDRQELVNQAHSLLIQKGLDEDMESLGQNAVQETLRVKLMGEPTRVFHIVPGDDGDLALMRIREDTKENVQIWKGEEKNGGTMMEAYQWVLEQITLGVEMEAIEKSYDGLKRAQKNIEGLVDDLTLVGKPPGRCRLCQGGI